MNAMNEGKFFPGFVPEDQFRIRFSGWIPAMLLVVLLQFLDLVTTELVLRNGGIELNPFFTAFYHTEWFWLIMGGGKLAFVIWAWVSFVIIDHHYPGLARLTCLVILVYFSLLVVNNVQVLSSL